MHSMLQNVEKFGSQLSRWYIDKYINNYSRVRPENIIRLKHYYA